MRKLAVLTLVAAGVLFAGVAQATAAEIRVDDDHVQCPAAPYTSIQAAVNAAAPGDTVKVCAGTYVEQVTIGAGKNGLKVISDKPLQAVIKAPPTMTEPGDIVRITQSQNVLLRGFTISGPLPDTLFCSPVARTGVRVDGNGSATIDKNHITEIRSTSPALRGCQNGVGIQVGRLAEGQVGTATITGNTIDLYQKNGMTIDNAGSSARVENNVVTDAGATEITAPNGIQVSRGANASVRGNKVSGNVFAGAPASNGTGILLFQAGGDTLVENNEVFANDDGISLFDTDNTTIKKNKSHDQVVYDGLFADEDSSGNLFDSNEARRNAEFDCADASTGTGTAGTANTWRGNRGVTQNRPGLCKP
jgi:parallel beta-helix repeat protein